MGAYKWFILLTICLIIGGIDQWSKHWAQTQLRTEHGGRVTLLKDYVALTYVRNPGAAWGFLARADRSFRRPFFLVVSFAAVFFILHLFRKLRFDQTLMMVALSLIMSGAIGNLIDRIRLGYVIDFLDFHIDTRFRWPTFNVADVAISTGVGLLLLEMILSRRKHHAQQKIKETVPSVSSRDLPSGE